MPFALPHKSNFRPDCPSEVVALHVEATGFDAATDRLLRVGAVRIDGNRIRTGGCHVVDFALGAPDPTTGTMLQRYLGTRPLVGFFVDFAAQLISRTLNIALPNQRIEVSSLYYDCKRRQHGKDAPDLRLASILTDLRLPDRSNPGALETAVSASLIYLRLAQRSR